MMRFVLELGDAWRNGAGIALRCSLVLAVAALLTLLLRHRSAATRHVVWIAAVCGVLALPLITSVAPAWRVLPPEFQAEVVEQSATATPPELIENLSLAQVASRDFSPGRTWQTILEARPTVAEVSNPTAELAAAPVVPQAPVSPRLEFRHVVMTVWLAGAVVLLLPMLFGLVSVRRLRRSGQPMSGEFAEQLNLLATGAGIRRRVIGVLSAERAMPMTWGWWQPVVLLPSEAADWSAERRRLVLLHELAHIQRWDCFTQMLGQFARAMYWFNPLAWFALGKLRIEQERACDDFVLNAGVKADDYAAELLSVTTRRPRATWDTAVALAMSRAARLEQRLAAIMDADCERRPLSAWRVAVLMILSGVVVAGIGAAQRQTVEAAPPKMHEIAFAEEPAKESGQQSTESVAASKDKVTPAAEKTPSLEAVLQRIEQHSAVAIDKSVLNDAAIRGVLESLKDPYSTLITAEQLKSLNQQIEGQLVGIGAALAKEEIGIVVTAVMPNSPALRSGLKPRDVIVEVNGQPANDLAESVMRIRGAAGTEVTLKIRRPDKQESQLTLKRDEVRVPSVKGLALDEQGQWRYWLDADQKIAFMQIAVFDKGTPAELKDVLTRLHEQGSKGLVLDLRGNPGGLLPACVEVAQLFLKEGTIVQVRGRTPDQTLTYSAGAANSLPFVELPLVVLIDPTTASAAEILAGALKDNNRAVLVGERTFGKGSVQAIFPLGEGGSALKLTTAQMFSPSGQPLHRSPDAKSWGVDPQDGFFVPQTAEQRTTRLKASLDRVTGQLKLPLPITADFAEKDLADPALAAALKTMSAKLKTGEFTKTGRPVAELQARLTEIDKLRKQLEELKKHQEEQRRKLEQEILDRTVVIP